jgi:NitT/TauT family transport system substrate-binding protein
MSRSTPWKRVSAIACLLALLGMASGACAEVTRLKIGRAISVGYLPIMVLEDQRLMEKHARAAGLGDVTIEYAALSGGAALNDALLSDSLQIASGGVPPFLLLWGRTQGNIAVKGLSPFNSLPLHLNTNDPKIRSIKDFGPDDRIAVLTSKSSVQAILLQMEAAKVFGKDQYTKLDAQTVSMPLADAATQLISGQGGHITSDFTVPPFSYRELAAPGVRTILTSEDVLGGPGTYTVAYTTSAFHDANPKLCAAFVAALGEAISIINRDRKLAGDIYLRISKTNAARDIVDRMLSDPSITFEQTPHGIMKFAEFMHSIGTLKVAPATWKDLFFPGAIHSLPGT